MTSLALSLTDREFWRLRQPAVAEAATVTADVLGRTGVTDGRTAVGRQPLAPAAAALHRITGGEPLLRWTALAAATAVVLRRCGVTPRVLLYTGDPVPRRLPILVEPAADRTFRELLQTVRARLADALAHGSMPDGQLWAYADGTYPPVVGRCDPSDAGLVVDLDGDAVTVTSARIPQPVAQALAEAVVAVLDGGLADVDRRTAAIRAVPVASSDLPGPRPPLRQALLRHALAHPDAVAVHDDDDAVGYADLVRAAVAIGVRLRALGVRPGDVVALSAPRSAWFVVLATGILFAGAAYLPIDPTLPPSRRGRVLRHAAALIGTAGTRPDDDRPFLDLADLRRTAERADVRLDPDGIGRLLGPDPAPDDLAYVIYTSGSTGEPKGACIPHGSFLELMAFRAGNCELRPGVEIPQTAPVSFDISVWQMFAGLTAGATVCVVSDDVVRDPVALAERAVAHRYGYLELVPSLISVLVQVLADDPRLAVALSGRLRGLISTGEALSAELVRSWYARMPQVPLLNAYGPAECTDDVTQGVVTPESLDGPYAHVGEPLPHAVIYVLDDELQPVPAGFVGEIYVGGPCVGRGYLGEPARTAAVFLPDPFSTRPGSRMYRTGDRGRWRPDGLLECLGRQDNQVKFRGRRIELGEIEAALASDPGVAMSAVELVRDDGLERLVAFVVPVPGADVRLPALMDLLADTLPGYMVPGTCLLLDELPANRNGKVDRAALRTLARQRTGDTAAYVAPRDDNERLLCELWARHLKVPRVGVEDDFFALGGDSITGIRLAQEAAQRGMVIRPRHFFEHRTVASLATVARMRDAALTAAATAVEPEGSSAGLTPVQRWFFEQDFAEAHHWNQSYCLEAASPLRADALAVALRHVVDHHEQLRVVFRDGVQVVGPVVEPLLWRVDPAPEDVEPVADRAHASLSLTDGPLLRAVLIGDRRLLLTVHHLVVDQVSWQIVLADLETAYRAVVAGHEPRLPARSIPFVRWARHSAATPVPAPPPLPVAALPAPRCDARVANVYGNRRLAEVRLDARATRRLARRAAVETDEGIQAVLLAGLARAMAAVHGAGEVLVEWESHGRQQADDVDISRTVGWFTIFGPLVLPVAPDTTPADTARALVTARTQLDSHLRQPAGQRAELRIGFNFLGRLGGDADDGTRVFRIAPDVGTRRSPKGHRPLEWEINAAVLEDSLVIALEYVPGRHDPGELDTTLTRWRDYLVAWSDEHGDTAVAALSDLAPLTPTQHSFLARGLAVPDHWNHGVRYRLTARPATSDVERAAATLLARHPALGARLVRTARGFRQGLGTDAGIPVTEVDLTGEPPDRVEALIDASATEGHRSLSLSAGPLCRWLHFRLPADLPDQLLVIAHHAIVDPYSWDIITEDLAAALSRGNVARPAPTTSYFEWARRLNALVRDQPGRLGVDYWRSRDWTRTRQLLPDAGVGLERHTGELVDTMPREWTERFLRAGRDRFTAVERLLIDLSYALGSWLDEPAGSVLVALGGHGREDFFDEVDLTRTVGWFTTSYPFALPLPGDRPPADHGHLVADRLREVPARGLGFEALRHLAADGSTVELLSRVPRPQLSFDFDGELGFLENAPADADSPFHEVTTEGTGAWKPPAAPRAFLVEINVAIRHRQLTIRWRYSGDQLPERRVRALAAAYVERLERR